LDFVLSLNPVEEAIICVCLWAVEDAFVEFKELKREESSGEKTID